MDYLKSQQIKKGTKVKLWTDSQSSLQFFFSLKLTSQLVEEMIKLLVTAKLMCQIELASSVKKPPVYLKVVAQPLNWA